MKKLYFLDNDNKEQAEDCINNLILPMLSGDNIKIKRNDIEVIHDFYSIEHDKLYDILYNPMNVIVTWSVYTATHFSNSKKQLLSFLRTAGVSGVIGCTYLDMTGMVEKALYNSFSGYDEPKRLYDILKAIELNNILTRSENGVVRLRINLSSDNGFKYEPINLIKILKQG